MEAKDALTGAAVAVLLAVLGFIILIGVILVMMWMQPGIEHSPSEESRLHVSAGVDSGLDVAAQSGHQQVAELTMYFWSPE